VLLDVNDGVLYIDDVAAVVVCNNVPPVSAEYQRNVPEALLLALSATDPGPHNVADTVVGAAGALPALTVAVTCLLELVHPPLSNSTQ